VIFFDGICNCVTCFHDHSANWFAFVTNLFPFLLSWSHVLFSFVLFFLPLLSFLFPNHNVRFLRRKGKDWMSKLCQWPGRWLFGSSQWVKETFACSIHLSLYKKKQIEATWKASSNDETNTKGLSKAEIKHKSQLCDYEAEKWQEKEWSKVEMRKQRRIT